MVSPSRAMSMKSALRDLLSVSYGKISILLTGSLRSPPPIRAAPDFPLFRGQNKTPRNTLFISGSTVSTGYSAPVEVLHRTSKWGEVRRLACPLRRFPFAAPPNCGGWQRNWIHRGAPRPANPVTCFPPGKVVAPATKGGLHFHARQGGCMVFAAKGGIKIGAKGAVPRQRSDTIYLPRAEPSNRPGGVSRSRTEPLAPRAKGPAAPSTLAAKPRQPTGILESTAPVPVPIPTAPRGA